MFFFLTPFGADGGGLRQQRRRPIGTPRLHHPQRSAECREERRVIIHRLQLRRGPETIGIIIFF